jgi:hypothetical protein
MPSGGCLCGNLKYEFVGDGGQKVEFIRKSVCLANHPLTMYPATKVLCHCPQCKKMTSSAFSTNIVIPASTFTIHGSPKHYTFIRGEEKHTTSFCGDCGTTVSKVVDGFEKFKDLVVVQAGTLDEGQGFADIKVDAELYVSTRAGWVKEIAGAKQVETVP